MAKMLIKDSTLTNIANAIREKTGNTAQIYPENMASQIRGIISGAIDTTGIDQGVVDEANRVVNSINNKKAANSVTFIAMSDMHEMGDGDSSDQSIRNAYRLANAHAGQGAELIAKQVNPDFFANLGDLAWGIQSYTVHDMAQSITNARVKTGSLERLTTCFATPGNHDIGYRAGSFDENLVKAMIGNYQYIDFDSKKVRVIVANTSDISDGTDRVEGVSGEQLQWFANALDLSSKSNASSWSILIFSHHPLDWNANTMPLANCVASYLNGTTYSVTHDNISISKSYSGKNSAKIIGTFHGHVHCFKVADLSTTTGTNTVKRIAIPNACNGRNNEYGKDGNLTFGEPSADTCPSGNSRKSTIAGQDTAFCVVTIDLDKKIIYADCFGSLGDTAPGSHAGYDRTISYGVNDIVIYSISNNLTNAKNSNTATSIMDGSAYSASITANDGYNVNTVTVKMGGVDITATAYSNGVITIANVTGDIVITVTTVSSVVYDVTNLVLSSEAQDSTNIYNGIGYKNGVYASENGDGTDASCVATGWIPYTWSPNNVIYVRGAAITSESHVRFYGFDTKTHVHGSCYAAGSNGLSNYFNIEEIEENEYYKLTPLKTVTEVKYIRISLIGTGENLIVTVNEPIVANGNAGGTPATYTVTNNLTNVSTSNTTASVTEGNSYSATLVANSGYELKSVTVTMGGSNVTSTVYNNGSINITSVTGNVVITAVAEETVTATYLNLVPTAQSLDSTSPYGSDYNGDGVADGYKNGYRLSSSSPYESSKTGYVSTGWIPYTYSPSNVIYIRGATLDTADSYCRLHGWEGKTKVSSYNGGYAEGTTISNFYTVEYPEGSSTNYYKLTPIHSTPAITYVRLSLKGSGENLVITVNEPIE